MHTSSKGKYRSGVEAWFGCKFSYICYRNTSVCLSDLYMLSYTNPETQFFSVCVFGWGFFHIEDKIFIQTRLLTILNVSE